MTLPDNIAAVLPESTRRAWTKVAAAVPEDAVLICGTALAVQLEHRVSRDLDLFTTEPFDVDEVARALSQKGSFASTTRSEGTLNGVLDDTKVQVLWARDQRVLDPPTSLAGMRIGSLADLLATKVKVIGDRGELRDYFDLMSIEEQTNRTVEEGLALYLERFGLTHEHPSLHAIVTGLGWFDDVAGDPYLEAELPGLFDRVRTYWQRRQPEVIASLDRWGSHPLRRPQDT